MSTTKDADKTNPAVGENADMEVVENPDETVNPDGTVITNGTVNADGAVADAAMSGNEVMNDGTNSADITLKPASSDVNSGDNTVRVGDRELTAGQYEFFLNEEKQIMERTELSGNDWETAKIKGKSAIDVAKERAKERAIDYLLMIEVGKKEGITCTQEEIDATKQQISTSYFDDYEERDSIINLICEVNVFTGKLQQKFLNETQVNDAEIIEYFNKHKSEFASTYLRAKHVLILTQGEDGKKLSASEIADRKSKADEILKRAKSGEDFDTLVNQFSEDPGSLQMTDGYVFGSGEMVPEFENCVRGLGINEIGFVESSYGYHIIKRMDLDITVEACKNMAKSAVYSEKFEKYIDDKKASYNIVVTK